MQKSKHTPGVRFLKFKTRARKFKSRGRALDKPVCCIKVFVARTMSRTMSWELNANEFVELVLKSGLKGFLPAPTSKDVGRVLLTQLPTQKREHPYDITDLGTCVYCAPKGKKIQLVGKKGKEHEDGSKGEVFLCSYFNRRVPKKDLNKLKSKFCNLFCLLAILLLFHHPIPPQRCPDGGIRTKVW